MLKRTSERLTLLTFEVAGQKYALAAGCVEQVVPAAEIDRPPNAPPVLLGFLNVAGGNVPVLRVHRLFQLSETRVNLWTPLIIVHDSGRRLALLVDRVHQVSYVESKSVLPLPPDHSLNDCVQGVWRSAGGSVLVISPNKLLLQQERERIAELEDLAEQRLCEAAGAGA